MLARIAGYIGKGKHDDGEALPAGPASVKRRARGRDGGTMLRHQPR
jgi:hypothetical protein